MKKIFLTAIAAASLCFLSACSDDPEPTIAEKCSGGLSEDCLVGTWNLKAIQTLGDETTAITYVDFGATPSTLVFTDDGKFEFTYTTNATVSEMAGDGCGGTKSYGSWEIAGVTLKIKIGRTDCQETGRSYTVTPTITPTSLNLNMLLFHENDMTDALSKANATEYYVRLAQ